MKLSLYSAHMAPDSRYTNFIIPVFSSVRLSVFIYIPDIAVRQNILFMSKIARSGKHLNQFTVDIFRRNEGKMAPLAGRIKIINVELLFICNTFPE